MTRSIALRATDHVKVVVALEPVRSRAVVRTVAPRLTRAFPRWVPWNVLGAGLAVGAASGALWMSARNDYGRFDQRVASTAGDPPEPVPVSERLVSRGDTKLELARGLAATGAALVLTSVVLWFVNRPKAERSPPASGAGTTARRFSPSLQW